MKATVKMSLGSAEYGFEINEDKELETLHKIAVLGNPPTVCDECGNDNPTQFQLTSNKDKEANIYINIRCSKCEADAKLGLYKSGGFFWHKFKKYVRGQN